MHSTSRIVAVDGIPTHGLDEFLKAVEHKADGEAVQLAHVDLSGRAGVSTLCTDLKWWPTYECVLESVEDARLADASSETAVKERMESAALVRDAVGVPDGTEEEGTSPTSPSLLVRRRWTRRLLTQPDPTHQT